MPTLTFPDVEKIFADITGGVLHLTSTGPGVVHHVYLVGGQVTGRVFRTDRVTIDTYAPTRDEARDASESVRDTLTAHFVHDLVDAVRVEVAPHQIPYPDEAVYQYQATYRVDTRPVP